VNLADPDPKLRAWAARTILHELGAQDGAPWVLIGHTLPRGTSELAVRVEGALSAARTIPLSAKEAGDWDGYHVAYLGLLVDVPRRYWLDHDRAENFWTWEDRVVDLWLRRATPGGSHLYAELVTAPGRRRDGAIRGLELQHNAKAERPPALRGWRLLVRLERAGGHPLGGTLDHIDPRDFGHRYWALADKHRDQGLPRLTHLGFAGELNVSEATVRRYREPRKIPWPPERPP